MPKWPKAKKVGLLTKNVKKRLSTEGLTSCLKQLRYRYMAPILNAKHHDGSARDGKIDGFFQTSEFLN